MRFCKPIVERFWEKVEKTDGCWLWAGKRAGNYGALSIGRRGEGHVYAHRFSYEKFIGPIPEGRLVCHTCDTPLCVNPEHLWLGTYSENMLDAVAKGRRPKSGPIKGVGCKRSISFAKAEEIREKFATGKYTQIELALVYGVSKTTACRIVRNQVLTVGE